MTSTAAEQADSVAQLVAKFLCARGVRRVYGLCGGHIQSMWDAVSRAGIDIVDVRHEAAAVYMAHAEAELTGRIGVAMVTAGPGLTNAVTPIANAATARAPVLVLSGRTPSAQAGMGAMQDVPQADIVGPLCRRADTAGQRHQVLSKLDAAWLAALGGDGPPGPAYLDLPTDLQNEPVHPADVQDDQLAPRAAPQRRAGEADLEAARELLARARRPLVIAGRGVHPAAAQLRGFLDRSGAVYLDTGESRGAVGEHPGYVPAMRARAMREADLVLTLGRRLDFQLGYGSPAVFAPDARFLRIGTSAEETSDNRRGAVELHADVCWALEQLGKPTNPDSDWLDALRAENRDRVAKLAARMTDAENGADGRMHPYRVLAAVNEFLGPDAVAVADGGDILSFSRVGLDSRARYLDCGALGCLGVGVPFATAAALNRPGAPVIAVIGDGSFGFTAMEVDTAVRHDADAVFVVVNNESWNIERHDMLQRYDGNTVGVDLPGCRYDTLAQSLGAYAERVTAAADLPAALRRGLANAPAVLDVLVTRDAISPDFTSGLAAVPSRQALQPWHEAELSRYE